MLFLAWDLNLWPSVSFAELSDYIVDLFVDLLCVGAHLLGFDDFVGLWLLDSLSFGASCCGDLLSSCGCLRLWSALDCPLRTS